MMAPTAQPHHQKRPRKYNTVEIKRSPSATLSRSFHGSPVHQSSMADLRWLLAPTGSRYPPGRVLQAIVAKPAATVV